MNPIQPAAPQQILGRIEQMQRMVNMEVMPESSRNVTTPVSGFGRLLKTQLEESSAQSRMSRELATAFELGDPSVSLADVMIQAEKSSVSFQAVLSVREKLLKSYQDIMNMPV